MADPDLHHPAIRPARFRRRSQNLKWLRTHGVEREDKEQRMTVILTTTGISLYLNTAKNIQPSPTDEQMRTYLREQPERASAEVKSLLQMAHPSDTLVFLHTDTSEADRC